MINPAIENTQNSLPLLEIFLLGKFQVKIDGSAIDEKSWSRRSARSLVKLLALKPFHSFHREQIMDLLWAEELPETAVNNLNKAIHGARRALEPDLTKGSQSRFILTQNNQVTLGSPGSLVVDLDEFERLANIALNKNDLEAAQKAFGLYRGDLLTEDIYEDWIYTRRESMRILFRKMATKTAEIYARQHDQNKSIEILQKLIASDGTDEYVHRLLMRFYAETGSKYQALKQFEHCRAALQTLGIEPEAETIELERKIKRGEILPSENGFKSAPIETPSPKISTPRITPLTFQNGIIKSARFLPDGETAIVGAAWEGNDLELYKLNLKTNEMRDLGLKNAEILSVSKDGVMAIALKSGLSQRFNEPGTLAIMDLSEDAPREILKNVQWADWHPSKDENPTLPAENFLAIVRDRNGRNCLEYPIGNVLLETGGWFGYPRFSADGKKIAFLDHPLNSDDEGFVGLLDLEDKSLKKQILTKNWLTITGLAWSNDEIWFTASQDAKTRSIHAVNLKGEERSVYLELGKLRFHDISNFGKSLVSDDKLRNHMSAFNASDGFERDLSWHDNTIPRDITDDGKKILVEEAGISSGIKYLSYIRNSDGTETRLIGSGAPLAISPDEKYVLVRIPSPQNYLSIINIETKETKRLETDAENSLIYQESACFFPDGKRILFAANKLNSGTKLYTQNIDGGNPACLIFGEESISMEPERVISPDGKFIVLKNIENKILLYRISDRTFLPLKNLNDDFTAIRWADDCKSLFIRKRFGLPNIIYRYNFADGTKEKWLKIIPRDTAGVSQIVMTKITPDGRSYAYSFKREFSDLYLMEDL